MRSLEMAIGKYALILLAVLTLAGCGEGFADRALSGAAVGAGTTAILGPGIVAGAIVGGAVGAMTNEDELLLGQPIW
jgi:osmotically inducible lipoprotein OsmB